MSADYPLYPSLTEQGEVEAQRIMDSFKPRLKEIIDEILGELYINVSMHIESDHWDNYRNQLMDGFKGYRNGRTVHEHDFKELRRAIYENHKDEIVADLNQDLLKENINLRQENKRLLRQLHELGGCRL